MTKASTAHPARRAFWLVLCGPALACLLSGCATSWPWQKKELDDKAVGPRDSFVLRGRGLERDRTLDAPLQIDLDEAKRLYQKQEYATAQPLFAKLANNQKNPINLAEEARFFEADCQYMAGNLRDASGSFKKYFQEFRNGNYAEQANRRMFDIANYWLDDTRKQMEAWEEYREGKRYVVVPASVVHFSKDMPMLDREGHAVGLLEHVYLNDIRGPMGEKALFYLATVKFFNESYKDADFYYQQLYENFPNSPLAPKAIKQAIICKQVCNHGPKYDAREVESSRKLIHTAVHAYPSLAKDDAWLQRQLAAINLQQADRDLRIAEFYRRIGHPGSAYFYYELVKRRYPNTDYARKAEEGSAEVRASAEHVTLPDPNANQPGILGRILNPLNNNAGQEPRILPPSFANSPGP